MSLLAILASPVIGSILGMVGQWLNRREERAKAVDAFKHEEKMTELRNTQEILVAEKKLQGVIEGAKIEVTKEEVKGWAQSQVATSPRSEMLKSWARLALVGYTALVCAILTFLIARQIGGLGSMDKATLSQLFSDSVNQFFFMFGLGFAWFFGARGSAGSTRGKLTS